MKQHKKFGFKVNLFRPAVWILLVFAPMFSTTCAFNPFWGIGEEDKQIPSLSIVYPFNKSIFRPAVITLQGTADDNLGLKTVSVSIDGGTETSLGKTKSWSFDWDATSAAVGAHTLTVIARDVSGLENTNQISVIIDRSAPSIVILNPSNGQFVTGALSVSGTASDDNGISNVEVSFDATTWIPVYSGTSSGSMNWSINLPATNLVSGLNYIYARTKDISGSLGSVYSSFYIINGSPSVEFVTPANGQQVNGKVSLVANIGGSFIKNVSLSIGANITNFGPVYNINHQWNTSGLDSGTNRILIVAVNQINSVGSNFIDVVIDRGIPTITVSNPAAGSYLSGLSTLSGTGWDDNGVVSVEFSRDATNWGFVSLSQAGATNVNWSTNIDTTVSPEGSVTYYLRVKDIFNNSSITALETGIVNTLPLLSISSPSNGTVVGGAVSVTGTAGGTFFKNVEARVNNGPWSDLGNSVNVSWLWNTLTNNSGTNLLQIAAYNKAGMAVTNSITLILDKTPPVMTVASPISGQNVKGALAFAGSVSDDIGVVNVEYSFDANDWTPVTNFSPARVSSAWSGSIPTSNLNEGLNRLYFRSTDRLGQSAGTNVIFRVVNSPVSIDVLSPTNGQIVSGNTTVLGNVNGSFISNIQLIVNSGAPTNLGSNSSLNYLWNPSSVASGTNTLTLIAVNAVGVTATNSFNIFVDHASPSLIILTPSNGQYVPGVLTMSGTASDDFAVKSVEISLDATAWISAYAGAPVSNSAWSVSLTPTNLASGLNYLYARSRDVAGNTFSTNMTFYYISGSPAVEFVTPTNGLQVNGKVSIVANISGNFMRDVILTVGTNSTNFGAVYSLNYQWNTAGLPSGTNRVQIIAVNQIGISNSNSINVVIDRGVPSVVVSNPASGGFLSGLTAVSGSASDDNGVLTVEFSSDGNTWGFVPAAPAGGTNVTWATNVDTLSMTEGYVTFYVRVKDVFGNVTTSAVNTGIVNSFPTLAVTSPSSNQVVGGVVTVIGTSGGTFFKSAKVNVNGGSWTDLGNSGSISWLWNTAAQSAGTNVIQLAAYNEAGMAVTNTIPVILDKAVPTLTVASPQEGKFFRGSAAISGTVLDDIGVSNVEYSLNAADWTSLTNYGSTPTSASWSGTLDTTALSEGFNRVYFRTTDRFGRTAITNLGLYAVNQPVSIGIVSPSDGQTLKGNVTVIGSIGGSYISNVRLSVNGGAATNLGSNANLNYLWNTSTNASGTNTVTVIAGNMVGSVATNTFKVVLDHAAPVALFSTPTNGQFMTGTLSLSGSATDDNAVSNLEISFDAANWINVFSGPSAPSVNWTLSISPTNLVNGLNNIYARAADIAGNVITTNNSFYYMGGVPSVEFVTPTNGQQVNGKVSIVANIAGSFMQSVEMTIGANVTNFGAVYNVNYLWNTASLPSGTNRILIVAVNQINATNSNYADVVIDKGMPAIDVTNPASGGYLSGNASFAGTASDDNGVISLEISHDGVNFHPVPFSPVGGTNVSWATNIDTTSAPEGSVSYTIRVKDIFENTGTYIVNTGVVNTPPWITVTSPTNYQPVGGMISVMGTAGGTFFSGVHLWTNNGASIDLGNAPNISWVCDSAGMNAGANSIHVVAMNLAGTAVTNDIIVILDKNAPYIALTNPQDGQYVKGSVSFSGSVTDDIGVQSADYSFDSMNWTSLSTYPTGTLSAGWVGSIDTATLPEGVNRIYLRSIDWFGRTMQTNLTLRVANSAPVISILSPFDGQAVNGNVTVAGTISGTYISNVAIIVNSQAPTNLGVVANLSWLWNTSTNASGSNTVKVIAANQVGVSSTNTFTVILDRGAPDIAISAPSEGKYVSGTIAVSGTAVDDVAVNTVDYSQDALNWTTVTNAGGQSNVVWSFNLDTTSLADGSDRFYIRATDLRGQAAVSNVGIFVANTPVSVTVQSLTDGQMVNGVATVSGSIGGSYISNIELTVSNWAPTNLPPSSVLSYIWSNATNASGNYRFRIVAMNWLGKTATNVFNVNLDRGAPTLSLSTPTNGQYVTGTVLLTGSTTDDWSLGSIDYGMSGETWTAISNIGGAVSSCNWSYNLDTTALPEGANRLYIRSVDVWNQTLVSNIQIRVMNVPLSMNIVSPTNGQLVSGNVGINGNVGGTYLSSEKVQVNSGSFSNLGADTVLNYTWLTASETSGTNVLRFIASNLAGSMLTNTLTVVLDKTAPVLTLSGPVDGQYVSGTVALTGNASDDLAVATVEASYDSITWHTVTNPPAGSASVNWSTNIDTSTLPDGANRIYYRTIDIYGHISMTNIQVQVANTPLSLSFTAPTNGQVVSGNVIVSGSAAGNYLAGVFAQLNGGSHTSLGANQTISYTWNTASAASGTNILSFIASNRMNGVLTNSLTLVLDKTAPALTLTGPTDGQYIVSNVALSGDASDDLSVVLVEMSFNSQIWYMISNHSFGLTSINWTTNISTTNLPEGANTVYYRVTDHYGKTTTTNIQVRVANTQPTVSFVSPTNGQIVSGNVAVNGTLGGTYLAAALFQLNGGAWSNIGSSPTLNFLWDSTSAASGTNTLNFVASNQLGTTSSNELKLVLDKTAPALTLTGPTDGQYVRSNITLAGVSTDDLSVESAAYSFDSQTWITITNPAFGHTSVSWSTNISITNLLDSANRFYFRTTDFYGHSSITNVLVYVVNTPLSVQIYSPFTNQVLSGSFNVLGSVGGTYLDSVSVSVNNGAFTNLGANGSINYILNTTLYPNSAVPILFIVSNKIGSTASNQFNVIIDNSAPTLTVTNPSNYTYASGPVTITGTAGDDYNLKSLYLSTNNGLSYDVEIVSNDNPFSLITSTNWSHAIDTTLFTGGQTPLWFKASDWDNKIQTALLILNIENSSPTVNISYPDLNVSGLPVTLESFVMAGSVSGTFAPSKVEYSINSNAWVAATLNNFSWQSAVAFSPSDPVTNNIRIRSVNRVSVTNSTNFFVVVDKELPVIAVNVPGAGQYLKGTAYDVYGTVSDDTAVDRVYISFDGASFSQVSLSNNNRVWYTNINIALHSEGAETITVKAYDKVGKSQNAGQTYTVDKTKPVVNLSAPIDHTTVSTNFSIIAAASDNYLVNYMLVKLDNVLIWSNSVNSLNLPLVGISATNHTIQVDVVDMAGNADSAVANIVVNPDPAATTNLSIDSDTGIYVRGMMTNRGGSYDTTRLFYVMWETNTNGLWITNCDVSGSPALTCTWTNIIDTATMPDGTNTIAYLAQDNQLGFTVISTNIIVDNTDPSGTINSPLNGNSVGGMLTVVYTVADNISLRSCALYTNNLSAAALTLDAAIPLGTRSKSYSATWDLTAATNGTPITNFLVTVDWLYHTNIWTNTNYVSNAAPTLSLTKPIFNQWVSSNWLIAGYAYRTNDGVKDVQIKLSTNDWIVAATNQYSLNKWTNYFTNWINTTNVAQGANIVVIRAISSNDSYVDSAQPIYIDYTPPVVSLTSPTNTNSYYGALTIAGTATDNLGLTNVFLQLITNGYAFTNLGLSTNGGAWSTNFDTTALPVSSNLGILLTAVDYASNYTTTSNWVIIRPYIASLSTVSTWIGNTLTVYGSNFGTGALSVKFNGATYSGTGANSNTVVAAIPAGAKSGYLQIVVNGVESINSNWIDLWQYQLAYNDVWAVSGNTRTAIGDDGNTYFVQGTYDIGPGGKVYGSNLIINNSSGNYVSNLLYSFNVSKTALNGAAGMTGVANTINVQNGVMAVMYSQQDLTYSLQTAVFTNNGTAWVQTANMSMDPTIMYCYGNNIVPMEGLCVDKSSNIHAVYSDLSNKMVKYAYSTNRGVSWIKDYVATNISFSLTAQDAQPSIVVDGAGMPHVFYYDNNIQHLRHSWRVSLSNWQVENVDNSGYNGLFSSATIGANGTIYVSYYNGDNGDLLLSYKPSGGSWVREDLDYSAITGQFTSVDVLGSEVAIQYYNSTYGTPWLALVNGGAKKYVQVPQFPGIANAYGKYGALRYKPDGTEIKMGFVEDTVGKLWTARYIHW